jgi:aerotolerance regulator-like protein
MTFLAPGWIAIAAAAALGVVAIHFIAWRLPRTVALPTARFVPDEPARLAARTLRPSDLALMALRAAVIMAGGLALARPVLGVKPRGTANVVAIERVAGDTAAVRNSLRGIPSSDYTTYVVFDTTAQAFTDEAAALGLASAQGTTKASLTVGLLAAIREARRLTRDYESVHIVLASTFTRDVFDQATAPVRSTWNDSIRVVRIPPPAKLPVAARAEVVSTGDDPVAAGIRLAQSHGLLRGVARVVRNEATAGDEAFASAGGALLIWPRTAAGNERVDGIHGGDATAIGYFIRMPTAGDSGRVIARWTDGTPAARESASGAGCVRKIGFDVSDVGDFVLTTSFQRVIAALTGPCGEAPVHEAAVDSVVAAIAARPVRSVSPGAPEGAPGPNRLAALFMALAVALAIGELAFRRGIRTRPVEQAA